MNKPQNEMGTIKFFKESVKNLKTVGTITRSSKFLCKAMIKPIDFSQAKVLVELGAGDGVVTKHILNAMQPDATLLSFELNSKFCNQMREKFSDKRLHIIEDDAAKVGEYLAKYNLGKADAVISALPFTLFPEEVSHKIINACKEHMKPNAPYTQMHYSLLKKSMYKDIFGNVELNFIPINVPPAWVMLSRNKG